MEQNNFRKKHETMIIEPDPDFTALLNASMQNDGLHDKAILYVADKMRDGQSCETVITKYTIRSIEYLIDVLHGSRHKEHSTLIELMKLIVAVPINGDGKAFENLKSFFAVNSADCEEQLRLFKKLQTIIVLQKNMDWDNAEELINELEPEMAGAEQALVFVYNLQLAQIHNVRLNYMYEYSLRMRIIRDCLKNDDPDAALYTLLDWINSLPRQKNPELRMSLLMNLYAKNDGRIDLITVELLYDLFELDDRMLKPPEKMQVVKKIFKNNVSLLTVQQMQAVYFFAGNYSSGMQSRFSDSILYYQYSNYFIYKTWQYLRSISAYLRSELSPEQFLVALVKIETRIVEFTNQISLQNNAYVETLQAEYEKIDELYKKVEELSLTDSLTGLHNRRYMEDNLNQFVMLSMRHKAILSFAMIDLDHFKLINDNFGHLAGDQILKDIGLIIKGHFRKSDLVVRYGGEEFFVALYDMPREFVLSNLESLRKRIEQHQFCYRQQHIPLTISIGVTTRNFNSEKDVDLTKIISEADQALYMAKKSGRNRVYVG